MIRKNMNPHISHMTYDKFEWDLDKEVKLLFLAVSGSHSYGLAREDSDLDLRGVRIPSLREILAVDNYGEFKTQTFEKIGNGVDVEIVPLQRYLRRVLGGNGNYLENLWQPHVVSDSKAVEELKELIMEYGLTQRFMKHYLGFAESQRKDYFIHWKLKCLLYTYRVLLSGIVLFRDKKVEFNLLKLNDLYPTEAVPELIRMYTNEKTVSDKMKVIAKTDYTRLQDEVVKFAKSSGLPEARKHLPKENMKVFNNWLYTLYYRR